MTMVRMLELAALIFSVLTGLLTSSLVIFKGGALVQLVDQHENRIVSIESRGSPPIREHERLDDEREARTRSDIKRMEDIITRYADMGAKLDTLNLKFEMLREQLSQKNGNGNGKIQ